jgi:hypothetical protein
MTSKVDLAGASLRQSHGGASTSFSSQQRHLFAEYDPAEMNSSGLLLIWSNYQHIIAVYALPASK